MEINALVAGLIVLSALFVARTLTRRNGGGRAGYPLPPQVKGGMPLIGNLHQLPKKRPWIQFAEWTKEYGKGRLLLLYAEWQTEH
jgi:hypothetical protein